MTDFFGSVRNVELSNSAKLHIQESNDKIENRNDNASTEIPLRSMGNFPSKPEVCNYDISFLSLTYVLTWDLLIVNIDPYFKNRGHRVIVFMFYIQAASEHFTLTFSTSFYCLLSVILGAMAVSLFL